MLTRITQFFFSLLFASNFSLPIEAKLLERIFALFRLQKIFVSLLFRFVFASFNFRSASDTKTSEKTLFSHQSEKILLPFRLISLWSENYGNFSLLFCFISLRSENDGDFSLPFRFILLRSENDGSFCFFLFCFRFVPFSFHFRFLCFPSMRNKRKKSTFFSHQKEKEILLPFRFISLRSKNDGAP